MTEYLIREAEDADGEALAALIAREWSAYESCASDAAPDSLTRPASHFAGRGGRLWLVTRDGAPAGSLGVAPAARDDEFELSLICLEKPARGQGLAAALLIGANAFAGASGGARLNAWVDERLVDGARFLERQSFLRDPGVRRRDDGSEALVAHYSREVATEVSSQLSEALPTDGA